MAFSSHGTDCQVVGCMPSSEFSPGCPKSEDGLARGAMQLQKPQNNHVVKDSAWVQLILGSFYWAPAILTANMLQHVATCSCNYQALFHWIGLMENLQETMVFTIKYRAFRLKFSHNPILWLLQPAPLQGQRSEIFLFLCSGGANRRCLDDDISCRISRDAVVAVIFNKNVLYEPTNQWKKNMKITSMKKKNFVLKTSIIQFQFGTCEQDMNTKHGTNCVKRLCWQSSKVCCLRSLPIRLVCSNKAQFVVYS